MNSFYKESKSKIKKKLGGGGEGGLGEGAIELVNFLLRIQI